MIGATERRRRRQAVEKVYLHATSGVKWSITRETQSCTGQIMLQMSATLYSNTIIHLQVDESSKRFSLYDTKVTVVQSKLC